MSIEKLRVRAGLTQKEVAKELGISKSLYGNIERGVKPFPIKHLCKFCRLVLEENRIPVILSRYLKDLLEDNGITGYEIVLKKEST